MKIKNVHLPERRGDEIERARIQVAPLPGWEKKPPKEWVELVETTSALQELKDQIVKRHSKRTRAIEAANFVISLTASLTKIPELNALKLGKPKTTHMAKIDVSKKIQKVLAADGWEAAVWALVALGGILSGVLQGEASYIAGGLAAGIKSGFQYYKSKQQEDK